MTHQFEGLVHVLTAAVGHGRVAADISVSGSGALPSAFAVTDLATASVANAAMAARRIGALHGGSADAAITVDRRLASIWFDRTIEPIGWTLPPVWDDIAGVYPCGDRWVRLHTNAPHHKAAALAALGCASDRTAVAAVVASWDPFELETAVVEAGGVASALRGRGEWLAHPQGRALQTEPLVHHDRAVEAPFGEAGSSVSGAAATPAEPLRGVRVLDLTRVLAGPVATRLLAGLGADVLRIDPPDWDEGGLGAEVNLGKRCARLDLTATADRARLEHLLAEADIVVHGYRRDALEGLGLGADARRALNPGLVDVSLDAWGHTGPWKDRRGFDSIVQIAAGVAHHGMVAYGLDAPKPLPVQALDHATGYTLAACALHGWADRIELGVGSIWRTSLAAHAELLWPTASDADLGAEIALLGAVAGDFTGGEEATSWGSVRRARPPFVIDGIDLAWANGAAGHGTASPDWTS